LLPSNPFGNPIAAAKNWWSGPQPNPSDSTDPQKKQDDLIVPQQNLDAPIVPQQVPKSDKPQVQRQVSRKETVPPKKTNEPVKQSFELFGHPIFQIKAKKHNSPQTFEAPLSQSELNDDCRPKIISAMTFSKQGMEAYSQATRAFRFSFVSPGKLAEAKTFLEAAKQSFSDSNSQISTVRTKEERKIASYNKKYSKKIISMEGWINRVTSIHGALDSVVSGVRKVFTWRKTKVTVEESQEEVNLKLKAQGEEGEARNDKESVQKGINACSLKENK